MTSLPPRAKHTLNMRTLIRAGVLLGAGAAIASATSVAFPPMAQASTTTDFALAPNGTVYAFLAQQGWLPCINCATLFYPSASVSGGGRTLDYGGYCPGKFNGGQYSTHIAWASSGYSVPYDVEGTVPDLQAGWRFCIQCRELFYYPVFSGYCPAYRFNTPGQPIMNEYHTYTDSYAYDLMYAGGAGWSGANGSAIQARWRWCRECHGLFDCPTGTTAGLCPHPDMLNSDGPQHDGTTSYNYYLFT
jgi:hypothetical protein